MLHTKYNTDKWSNRLTGDKPFMSLSLRIILDFHTDIDAAEPAYTPDSARVAIVLV